MNCQLDRKPSCDAMPSHAVRNNSTKAMKTIAARMIRSFLSIKLS